MYKIGRRVSHVIISVIGRRKRGAKTNLMHLEGIEMGPLVGETYALSIGPKDQCKNDPCFVDY